MTYNKTVASKKQPMIRYLLKKIHENTGFKFYLWCGYTAGGHEYTCIFSGDVSDESPLDNRLFFDGGMKVNRKFYEKYLARSFDST